MTRYDWLPTDLAVDAVVITASRRLARELLAEYGERQFAAGRRAWRTPDILFIGDFLSQVLDNSAAPGPSLRIGTQASGLLWEQALRGLLPDGLPGTAGMIRQCRQAWARVNEWRVPAQEIGEHAYGREQNVFVRASTRYRAELEARNWIDDALALETCAAMFDQQHCRPPAMVWFAGFDRFSPGIQRLIDTLEARGSEVNQPASRPTAKHRSLLCFHDQEAELRAAGHWAIEQKAATPDRRIAIICPDLEEAASRVSRIVRDAYAPGWQHGSRDHRNAVNVSYGQPLARYPAVSCALLLLRWASGRLYARDISVLLRSPAVGGPRVSGRCTVEAWLRRLPDRQWRMGQLLDTLPSASLDEDTSLWVRNMQSLAKMAGDLRKQRGPAAWAEAFDALLQTAGWPGEEKAGSETFQLVNRWRELLNEFARLEIIEHKIGFASAVARLGQMASMTVFQPESETGSLPVLGALEAAGMEFDALWLCGFDQSRWPGSGSPLPFVARQLQRRHAMPDSSVEDTFEFSRRVLDRLLRSTDEMRVSWARTGDGLDQQLSPFVPLLNATERQAPVPAWYASCLAGSCRTELPDDDPVPAVAGADRISGGAYTVQRQTVDPFSAFANGRLHATELQPFLAGLAASLRGSVIHEALRQLYDELPAQATIAAWSDRERADRIARAADIATRRLYRNPGTVLRRILDLERRRVETLLLAFIEQELERAPFSVRAVEQAAGFERHNIELGLQIDRVDNDANGDAIVIDYKSGQEKTLLARDGGIKDLQLVLYALALDTPAADLAIINVDSRIISMKSARATGDWQAQFGTWEAEVDTAMTGLATGDARVNTALSTDQARPLNVLSRFEELRRG